MRIRKLATIGALILVSACFGLYLLLDRALNEDRKKVKGNTLFQPNFNDILEVRAYNDSKVLYRPTNLLDKTPFKIPSTQCTSPVINPKVNIQMGKVYQKLNFNNVDGGVWKQGWNVQYSSSQWNENNKLKIFVVPHSHNDPGWKNTFEEYFKQQTRSILNNMVDKLMEDERRKFIWAEISFFSLWWSEIDKETKDKVKTLIKRHQLEIVTGGWVMSDEANSHYYSLIEQLMHGHQWLLENLEYRPRTSWSIDPFGLSSTLPFILKHSGFSALTVQRSHYSVKKHLAKNKQLEFNWRQLWDGDGANELLTHMMPFYSYDVPHTCGPDPKICCQFDFKRLPGYGLSCPWRASPQVITDNNVEKRAMMLLDQYRKKAQLYSTNVLLVPLGDDFRYDHDSEWDAQYGNYQKLFDYINSNPSMNAQAQFGTLSDYFNALEEAKPFQYFPSLSGDFFTYADRDDHYWSGYYTSRPFYKRMDRILVSFMRAAEILFALATRMDKSFEAWPRLYSNLSDARASHSLFQHHDGITGTAKDHVVLDYAMKMIEAIKLAQHVIQQSAHFLLSKGQVSQTGEEVFFLVDEDQKLETAKMSEQFIIIFPYGISTKQVTFFNPSTFKRVEVVHLKVENTLVQVRDMYGRLLKYQISPICSPFDSTMKCYQLSFIVDIEPLSLKTYTIELGDDNQDSYTKLKIFDDSLYHTYKDWPLKEKASPSDFSIENDNFTLVFTAQGFLKSATIKSADNSATTPINLSFNKYNARGGAERSGAYLFLPGGNAKRVQFTSTRLIVLEGIHFSRVIVYTSELTHVVTLYNIPGADDFGVEIQNLINIVKINDNYELAMRFQTNIKNGDVFSTDLNGVQMIKRNTLKKLPIQGNFYPMPSAAFIEDSRVRLTLLTAQPLGVAALHPGEIEIMQDRRLLQDDNRGLGQPVMDNRPTLAVFRLLLEPVILGCQKKAESPWSSLSTNGEIASQIITYPILKMVWVGDSRAPLPPFYSPIIPEMAVNVHLVLAHALKNFDTGIVLKTSTLDSCFSSVQSSGKMHFDIGKFLHSPTSKVYETTLTFNEIGPVVDPLNTKICENTLKAYFVYNGSN
ncbi:alpha-mannosidase 2 isoform X2 [Cimex lectularius]|nr:alpha-mannosidase 2 isoform X2 [Cimex lectularius]XP_024085400.1 alpha-mannosidase 2 isoform X2 [Cimex lectularius]